MPVKYYTPMNSITEYSGKVVRRISFCLLLILQCLHLNQKLSPPGKLLKQTFLITFQAILTETVIRPEQVIGIQDTEVANEWLCRCINSRPAYIGLDSETTGLYPRDGHVLGISVSYERDYGVYIDTECFDERTEALLQTLFNQTKVIFHNAKFDIAFFEYHFNWNFPDFEDTMLLHYLIDENPGTHGLKQLAMKWTPYGDYEQPMYDWIAQYCKSTGTLRSQFTWDSIPFDIMQEYAAMDAVVTLLVYEKVVKIKKNKQLLRVYEEILIPGYSVLAEPVRTTVYPSTGTG